ncbi:MAG: PDZ domain-containing protein [Chloroflexi bacterium]|nr:PDZ domain-containing protein [Chloroflexota bacterium]
MKFKVISAVAGVLLALGVLGATTIWAQGGSGGTPTAPAAPAACTQYLQALAQHLGVSVDKLTQAEKDTAKDMVDQAVKDGRLTADQATAAKQRIDQATGACGFGRFEPHGFGGFGGPGGFRGFGGSRGGQPGQPGGPGHPMTGTLAFNGATIIQVVADSPAAKAGLQAGDKILAIGEQSVDGQHLLDALIRQHKPGETVALKIQRGSDTKTVNVTLGAQSSDASAPYLGIQFNYRPRPPAPTLPTN